ncbi:MAG TPA: maleate cis-trans isomerase [Pseudonocardia sp.]|uniref:maleate cis-trans isomerase family protein n=1 Tax=Pseudonocardia sp. TaxID=60912 RepID=UPI002EDBA8A3
MRSIGFLYPGYSAEDDYPTAQKLIGDSAELRLVHTVMREDAHRVDALLDIGSDDVLADGVRALADPAAGPGCASVIWACTSGSFVFGWDGASAQVEALREVAGAPASSTSFAFTDAAARLGVTQVAVAATYPDDVAERFVTFLAAAGISVVRLSTLGIVTAAEVGTLGRDRVLEVAAAGDHPDAEAVLLPDTALHTMAWLDELELRLGKPVLTANQVSIWQGLRLAGDRTARRGLGRLFTEPPAELPPAPAPGAPA